MPSSCAHGLEEVMVVESDMLLQIRVYSMFLKVFQVGSCAFMMWDTSVQAVDIHGCKYGLLIIKVLDPVEISICSKQQFG